jgi:hypothetical protein
MPIWHLEEIDGVKLRPDLNCPNVSRACPHTLPMGLHPCNNKSSCRASRPARTRASGRVHPVRRQDRLRPFRGEKRHELERDRWILRSRTDRRSEYGRMLNRDR